ncbi:MAG: hypothetical protein EOR12_16575 [Mesorhizobium sp.]|uniref:hypothetical protein n=1 Tax=Mesorhizobium sp. TaxID=1871066 RepID=UPI000FE88B5C|nr:hypothetical protein [Mesorhizobium sp.]RWP88328.1 MAG: hypothetical protein EOR12_16575 [Mesorhizobium sp.]
MTLLDEVSDKVAGHMDEILKCFKAGAKITVLVRAPDKATGDFCLSDDDLGEVAKMVERRRLAGPDNWSKGNG